MSKLDEQVAVVTGGARGIGEVTARLLAGMGAAIVLNDLDEAALHLAGESLRTSGARVKTVVADVTTQAGAERLIAAALDAFGRLDALVNNAGGGGSVDRPPALTIPDTSWQDMLAMYERNLGPTFQCTRAALPAMRERRYGRIVNIASLAGRSRSITSGPAYAAAKAAIIGFTRHVSAELGADGITINAVAPGLTFTDRVQASFSKKSAARQYEVLSGIPLGRAGTPEEQAAAIVFLCTPAASYITGAVLDVNGGLWVG